MKTFQNIIKTIAICAIVFSCSDTSDETRDLEKQQLKVLKNEIEQMVEASQCSENSECDFIAFGSKPCGGPWSYIVYPTSIDVESLKSKVEYYNEQENLFNIKWEVISDCLFVGPPSGVECVDGKCEAVYDI